MKADNADFPVKHSNKDFDADDTQKLLVIKRTGTTSTLEKNSFATDYYRTCFRRCNGDRGSITM